MEDVLVVREIPIGADVLVVREIHNDGKQQVYLLRANDWTLQEFQMWMFGLMGDGSTLENGSQRNEILGYYPNVDLSGFRADHPLLTSEHAMWADPDGLPHVWFEGVYDA